MLRIYFLQQWYALADEALEGAIYDSQSMRDFIGVDLAKARQRDPDMKQTQKGNQLYFGMKAHIGVDAVTGLTHSVVATSANIAECPLLYCCQAWLHQENEGGDGQEPSTAFQLVWTG